MMTTTNNEQRFRYLLEEIHAWKSDGKQPRKPSCVPKLIWKAALATYREMPQNEKQLLKPD